MNEHPRPTREQERELLQLQCRLARLKLQTESRLHRRRQAQENRKHHALPQLLELGNRLLQQRGLLKLALLPSKWKYRLLLCSAATAKKKTAEGLCRSKRRVSGSLKHGVF